MNKMSSENLLKKLDAVESYEDFIEYIELLKYDSKSNKDSWQNEKVSDALEAISAWLEDSVNCGKVSPKDMSWGLMANLLYAIKIYE